MEKLIYIVDDETSILDVIEAMLANEGYLVKTFSSAMQAYEAYREQKPDLLITDMRMPEVDGLNLLERVREIDPAATIVMVTAYTNAEDALKVMKMGCFDYVQKPFKMDKLRLIVKRALKLNEVVSSIENDTQENFTQNFHGIISRNKVMKKLFEIVRRSAPSKSTILLQGESGTGKELFARSIHEESGRDQEPFIPINCGALPEHLLESELFGHVKGSFTGAIGDKEGLFVAAGKGTLFLDEISSLPLALQSKILRVLQEKEVRPVGGLKSQTIHCRVVAATNESLEYLVEQKQFREDLYFRLNVIPIEIPPLRERMDDILILVEYLSKRFRDENPIHISPMVLKVFMDYSWPGNIRELENLLERLSTLCEGNEVKVEELPLSLRKQSLWFQISPIEQVMPLKNFSIMAEGQYIQTVLRKTGYNRELASRQLGIDPATLSRKLERFERLQNS